MPRVFGRPQWKPGAVGKTCGSRKKSSCVHVKLSRVAMKDDVPAGAGGGGGAGATAADGAASVGAGGGAGWGSPSCARAMAGAHTRTEMRADVRTVPDSYSVMSAALRGWTIHTLNELRLTPRSVPTMRRRGMPTCCAGSKPLTCPAVTTFMGLPQPSPTFTFHWPKRV